MHHITALDYLMSTFGSLTLNLSLLSEKSITPLSIHTRTETLNCVASPPYDACDTDHTNTDGAKQVQTRRRRLSTLVSAWVPRLLRAVIAVCARACQKSAQHKQLSREQGQQSANHQ